MSFKDEFEEIVNDLGYFSRVFAKLWQLGVPSFSTEIPSTAVSFNQKGQCINFFFNPDYWKKIDYHTKIFVICHEMLHVILNHGSRLRGENSKLSNVAMDISINHMLLESFYFEREKIMDSDNFCWVDTIFPNKEVPTNESSEYYFNLLKGEVNNVTIDDNGNLIDKSGNVVGSVDDILNGKVLVDTHSWQESGQEIPEDVLEKIFSNLSKEEEEELEKMGIDGGKYAGKGNGSTSYTLDKKRIKNNDKWVEILKAIHTKVDIALNYSFAKENRRNSLLPKDLMIPGDHEVEAMVKNKYNIVMFLDLSGSCHTLRQPFFDLSRTLDPRKFKVHLVGFADRASPFIDDKGSSTVSNVGVGTSFTTCVKYLTKYLTQNKIKKHPIVIMITDGWGDDIRNVHNPENWYVLLSESHSHCFSKESNIFQLNDIFPSFPKLD